MSFPPQYHPNDSNELRRSIAVAKAAWKKTLDTKATKIDFVERIRRFQITHQGNIDFIKEANALIVKILCKPKKEVFRMSQCEDSPQCLRDLMRWVNDEFSRRLDRCDLIAFEAILHKYD